MKIIIFLRKTTFHTVTLQTETLTYCQIMKNSHTRYILNIIYIEPKNMASSKSVVLRDRSIV